MRWEKGRAEIDRMIGTREIERVTPSRQAADEYLAAARLNVADAIRIGSHNPRGAYCLLYDAARFALAAILENEGLRVTSRGGHIVVYQAVLAQLHPPMGPQIRPFDVMRRRRNNTEYSSEVELTSADVDADLPAVQAIIELAAGVLDGMSPY